MTTDAESHTDLQKVREWLEASDGREPDEDGYLEWPAPPDCVEWRVSGQMRADVLRKMGRRPDDPVEVRLIERDVEGGWSEFTIEHDYEIEVWLHDTDPVQAQRVFDTSSILNDGPTSPLARFLRWVTS